MGEVDQVGFVLEMAGVDGIGHIRLGRPVGIETAHLVWGRGIQKPILIFVRLLDGFGLVLADLRSLVRNCKIGRLRACQVFASPTRASVIAAATMQETARMLPPLRALQFRPPIVSR